MRVIYVAIAVVILVLLLLFIDYIQKWMKNKFGFLIFIAVFSLYSCEGVEPGHQGARVSWGGKTDMTKVYDEGLHSDFMLLFDHIEQYDARQQTLEIDEDFLDTDGLSIPIKAIVYYNLMPNTANKLHKEIGPNYVDTKVQPIFRAALKNVIPRYKALELNTTKRHEADQALLGILKEELAEVYVECPRVNIVDINIPKAISDVIIAKQKQDESNLLAEKKRLEEENLAEARVAKAKGDLEVAKLDAQSKEILSQPKMLDLYKLETERMWATKGVSPYGNNNVFGSSSGIILTK